MQIQNDHVVMIHYTLRDDAGEVIDSSEGADPLTYLHGHQNIVPGLENALTGGAVGDKKDVVVEAADGYGERQDGLTQTVPRDAFQVEELEVGMQFHAESVEGQSVVVTVTNVADGMVTIDGNHPLAGQRLNFAVEIVGVREASATELEHGHVHAEGSSCES